MKLTRLRLAGFKTFVDPSEILIQPGLTGIVGPNGCGKSNLVEALRWVMGENSYKALRASEMDDVIFAGSAKRPARNMAEVSVWIDNGEHRAPAPYTQVDELEISRRIEREKGSVYRVNGKDTRARDVQLLFADASTGARSPSMVRQGQIAEIISANPQSRRRVLEEAAGISGLHTRRQEAETRLKTSGLNLQRVDDVLRGLDGQLDNLRRQAKQALRYRSLSSDIRRCEREILRQNLSEARKEYAAAHAAVLEAERSVAQCLAQQHETARNEAVAQHELKRLREESLSATAALERVKRSGDALEQEETHVRQRLKELEHQQAQLAQDEVREAQLSQDAASNLARIETEIAQATNSLEGLRNTGQSEQQRIDATALHLQAAETALLEATAAVAERNARRDALMRNRMDSEARLKRMEADYAAAQAALAQWDNAPQTTDYQQLATALSHARHALGNAEQHVVLTEHALNEIREAESAYRPHLREKEQAFRQLDVEVRTLTKMLAAPSHTTHDAVLHSLNVKTGYERAFAAAFGDDAQASVDNTALMFWADTPALPDDPPLPDGIEPLALYGDAPAVLQRRLAQTGLVEASQGADLQPKLAPGQCLVSQSGDLWRWDGYTVRSDAPSATAIRLAERNRLAELEAALVFATTAYEESRLHFQTLEAQVKTAQTAEQHARTHARESRKDVDRLQAELTKAEAEKNRREAKQAECLATLGHREASLRESRTAFDLVLREFDALPEGHDLEEQRFQCLQNAEHARRQAADARAALDAAHQRRHGLERRQKHLLDEQRLWQKRSQEAGCQNQKLAERRKNVTEEYASLCEKPDQLAAQRKNLRDSLHTLEIAACTAQDALNLAETRHTESSHAARDALRGLADVQTNQARAEERRQNADMRLQDAQQRFDEAHKAAPLLDHASEPEGSQPLRSLKELNAKLDQLRKERERLGAVNLRAEEELKEAQSSFDALQREQADLTDAIRKLRQGLNTLNQEGRERLLAAFALVNEHFIRLFSLLFGGGEAQLELIEAEDPLQIGLEVIARPPGKRPQTLSLLSGGEQALTAMALIFAIFLTNPAPICVLDEVDAPLDDANVERFCNLLENMRADTDTRFLVITHNPVSMSRMDRLFGVTMAERGVSQLVSVNLQEAETLLEVV